MKNNQKLVLTMLTAVLLLEFGSLTKIRKVWQLAFIGASSSTTSASSAPAQTAQFNTAPATHPVAAVTL